MDISVSVSDGTDPIQGVAVTLTDVTDETKTYTGTSGSAGGCTLNDVALGEYTVSATKEGYSEYTDSLTVTEETDSLEIEMEADTQEENPQEP